MHWQGDGDFLCVKVQRKKTKTKTTTNFEVFCLREKEIPIESREVTDTIVAFRFEEHGNKFGIIHGDNNRPNVDFFTVKKGKMKALGACTFCLT